MTPRNLALAAVAALLWSCGHSPPPPDSDPPPANDEPPPTTQTQRRMHDRYDSVEAIRDALIDGHLARAQELARPIGPVGSPHLPVAVESLRDVVPSRARDFVAAEQMQMAGPAFAYLVQACGECHRTAAVDWTWEDRPLPSGEDVEAHMQRHLWAMDRMWEALLTDDPTRFDRAAQALSGARLHRGETVEGTQAELADRVHERARAAPQAVDMVARAAIYGELLVTCADCHTAVDAAAEAQP